MSHRWADLKKVFLVFCNFTLYVYLFKANHLTYTEPRWYGSRISADCQHKLLFTKHDTSERFLLITLKWDNRRERTACRDNLLDPKCLRLHWNKELLSWDERELNFVDNFTCFSWLLDVIIINCNSRWIEAKSNHFSQREGFTSDCSNSDQDCTRGKNVASIAVATSSTTDFVKTNIQPQV